MVQRGSRAAIWKHFGGVWGVFVEHLSCKCEQMRDTLGSYLRRFFSASVIRCLVHVHANSFHTLTASICFSV